MFQKISFIALITLLPLCAKAQEKVRLIGFGSAETLDTYLSQENYKGAEVRYVYATMSPLKRDALWSRYSKTQVSFATTKPRSNDGGILGGQIAYSYGMQRQVLALGNATLAVGAQANGFLGGLYSTRNGNNPTQLKAGIEVSPAVRADYRFRLFKKNLRLSYQAAMPLAGLQFSPAYGQSYYEIFAKGNYDGNICFAHPGNALSYSHALTVDVKFKKFAITVGYMGDYRQSELNQLKYHSYTNSLLIGYTL